MATCRLLLAASLFLFRLDDSRLWWIMNTRRIRLLKQWFLMLLSGGFLVIALIVAIPFAMQRQTRDRISREQRLLEATELVNGRMAVEKEVRRMSIRHKPRPVPSRNRHPSW